MIDREIELIKHLINKYDPSSKYGEWNTLHTQMDVKVKRKFNRLSDYDIEQEPWDDVAQ
jgi:hypothetical protein